MSTWTLLTGDVRETLAQIPDGSVQCVVTSPPYFGLRDYGADGQIGLEPTPEAYVAQLVAVFGEVRRVLADDGILWLNVGDSYAGSWGARGRGEHTNAPRPDLEAKHGTAAPARRGFADMGIKPKDLMMIPARVAIALQSDGWWIRSDVIWSKPNGMPESVTDRPTLSHEYLFLLTKSERYYYNPDPIREPHADESVARIGRGRSTDHKYADGGPGGQTLGHDLTRALHPNGKNARSVWTINTVGYTGAHFATMPPELAERCILVGSRPGDTVLDPFGGSGTTAMVATGHGRRAILCELNPEYADLIRERCGPMLEEPAESEAA